MKRNKKPGILPVSQRQLAQYLGISSSMMHMAESSRHPSHQLSAASSAKLSNLMLVHLQQQQKRNGRSWEKLQQSTRQDAAKELAMLETAVAHAKARAAILANRLKEMQQGEVAARQWLNTMDRLLEALPGGKAGQADRKWLANQQALTEERLLKHSWLQQAKLAMQVAQEKMKIVTGSAMLKKLRIKTGGAR